MARGCPRRRWVRRPFHRKAGERNMVAYKTLDQLDVAGKRVLMRVDLNVPMQDGKVSDATRIERLVPTIEALTKAGARVVLISHFGRPQGKAGRRGLPGPADRAAEPGAGRPQDRLRRDRHR